MVPVRNCLASTGRQALSKGARQPQKDGRILTQSPDRTKPKPLAHRSLARQDRWASARLFSPWPSPNCNTEGPLSVRDDGKREEYWRFLVETQPRIEEGCADQAFFFRFLFEVCWLVSFFSPEVFVQGELVRARGFRSQRLTPPWRVSLGVVLVGTGDLA